MKKIIGIIILATTVLACNTSKDTSKKADTSPSTEEMVIGHWEMLAIRFHDGKVMLGEYMGFPHYEYTKNGKRVKTLRTQPTPPPDTVSYQIEADTVYYPNTKLPAMTLTRLEADTMVLSNDKLSWFMARAKPLEGK